MEETQLVIPKHLLPYFKSWSTTDGRVKLHLGGIEKRLLDWLILNLEVHDKRYADLGDARFSTPITEWIGMDKLSLADRYTLLLFLDAYDVPLVLESLMQDTADIIRTLTPQQQQEEHPAAQSLITEGQEDRLEKILSVYLGNNLGLLWGLLDKCIGPLVVCGKDYTMVLASQGLYAFGDNRRGQLGVSKREEHHTPQKVPLSNVTAIACGGEHSLVNTSNGLYASGDNTYGQLGLGNLESQHKHQKITRLADTNIIAIACGEAHSMILTGSGLFACGLNEFGQLGLGHTRNISTPQRINLDGVIGVACGRAHTIIHTKRGLYACGSNIYGQLGLGVGDANQKTPERVDFRFPGILSVSCGWFHTIVHTKEGLYGFGSDREGQLGLGRRTEGISTPLKLKIADVTAVATGGEHTIMLSKKGILFTEQTLWATGSNFLGQLGLHRKSELVETPTKVEPMLPKITVIACGGDHTMVIANKQLYACGNDRYGQLGMANEGGAHSTWKLKKVAFSMGLSGGAQCLKSSAKPLLNCTVCLNAATAVEPIGKRLLFCSNSCYRDYVDFRVPSSPIL